ncbi:cytochrome P450 [Stagonosporopsis vannaccii]|nr:cytochrome P450 [Stagonosporopsis vannaccii]
MFHILNVIVTYLGAATTLIIAKFLYNVFLHPLRHYPGPKIWAATRLMWARAMQSGDYHQQLHAMHKRYGPVIRVAPNELSFIAPEAWKDIYGNRNIRKNSTWTGNEEKDHPFSIVSTDEATHLKNKRALTGAFTEHAIAEHSSILEELIGLMIQRFKDAADSADKSTVLNIVNWFNWLTFDISGALSFGESFDSVQSGHAHPWVDISCNFGKGIALMASINFFYPLNKILQLAMPKSVMEKMRYHKQLAHEKLLQRLSMEHKATAQDYVGSIMAYNEEKGEVKIPKEEIEANMTLLIFAGSETTSSAMSAIMTELLRSPSALSKATQEVRSSFNTEKEITVASVAKLDYLTAVIKEGIRMGPPAGIGVPRVVPEEGAMIMGKLVPGGTFVSVNQYPAFRSAANFTRPDTFVPERFLSSTPFYSDNLDAYEPFLVGRHKCIGQKLAWAIMRLTLARILFSFDLKPVHHVADFGKQKTYIFWEKTALRVSMSLSNRV